MSDGPKQLIVFPDEIITSRDNVESVTSEAGEHVGPSFPKNDNEGNMLPFQETYGQFTEANIDYRLLRSGGIGSAQWGWKLRADAEDQWRGEGDMRYQTGAHDPFRAFAGKESLGADGHCIIVSKTFNRLIVMKRYHSSSTNGSVWIAYRDIGADDKQKYFGYEFKPSTYTHIDEDIECQMKRVAGCELPDGSLRMVANTSPSNGKTDFHLFGSDDGGLTWKLLQQNIISRWFNQRDKTKFPSEVRAIKQVRMASSGDWMRVVWYASDGYLHTMVSSDRGATWENTSRTPFKGHYQPGITETMLDDCTPSGSRFASAWAGVDASRSVCAGVEDHQENHRYAYFDLVGLGSPDGGMALVMHPRLSSSSTATGGIDAKTNIIMLSGVRDTDWAIARGLPSEATGAEWTGSGTDFPDAVNEGRTRCLHQDLLAYGCLTACATPFWLYVFVWTTSGGTGHDTTRGLSPSGGSDEGVGGGRGYTRNAGPGNEKQAAAGGWSAGYAWNGWIGWRVPINNPFAGSLQSMYGDENEGVPFPGPAGQGKLFVPLAPRCAWAGDRLIMLHGATYNGAHDGAVINGGADYSGPMSGSARRPFYRYQSPTISGAEDVFTAFEEGYVRRGASIDNPIRRISTVKQSQKSAGRSWSVVTWWGGWDRLPISDPDRSTIGDDDMSPLFGDYWSVQYGLPHVNGGASRDVAGGSPASTPHLESGGFNQWFNIIGQGTPAPGVYNNAFVDCAQGLTFWADTCNAAGGSWNNAVSCSMWSSVSDTSGVFGYTNASDWSRTNRTAGDKTLDWEMDRVSIQVNWPNPRSGSTGTGGSGSFMYFDSTVSSPNQYPNIFMDSVPSGFARFPGHKAAQNRLWGFASDLTDYYHSTALTGGTVPLGNSGLVGWTCSCPDTNLAAAVSSDANPNNPQTRVAAASSYKFCAMRLNPYLEHGGIGSGGDLYIGDLTVAMGSGMAMIVDSSSTTGPYNSLATLTLPDGFGSPGNPIFYDFRLVMYRRSSDEALRVRLAARRTGFDGEYLKSSLVTLPTRITDRSTSGLIGTGPFYTDVQRCRWGMLDPWIDGTAGSYECSQYWREFFVSYYGSGATWNQIGMDNPDELPGRPCATTPVYVTKGIYARWGGGGGFIGDEFTGTVDHTYAVENVFTPSPSTMWKSDPSTTGSSVEDSVVFKADPAAFTASEMDSYQRSSATWLALYGLQDRSVCVDLSYRRDFAPASTSSFIASSLLSTFQVQSVADTKILIVDATATAPNAGRFKEGELAGKYIGWMGGSSGKEARCAKILTNRFDSAGFQAVFIDPLNLSPGLTLKTSTLASYGLGTGAGITADIWSDRCAIDLTNAGSRIDNPSGFPDTQWQAGFSFMRLRFFGPPTLVGTKDFGSAGYHTVSGQHTIGTMILGRGINFDVPLQWEHTDSTTPNVDITTLASGQKTAYKRAAPRRSVSFTMPGDINSFRYRLQNNLNIGSGYTQKPVSLILQTDSSDTIASDRFNILARYTGEFSNANVAWRRDENNIWVPIGDTGFQFDEEL